MKNVGHYDCLRRNCQSKWSTMAINTFNISRGRNIPLQVLFTANLSFQIFQLTEGFGV